jgi:hypothetical protein
VVSASILDDFMKQQSQVAVIQGKKPVSAQVLSIVTQIPGTCIGIACDLAFVGPSTTIFSLDSMMIVNHPQCLPITATILDDSDGRAVTRLLESRTARRRIVRWTCEPSDDYGFFQAPGASQSVHCQRCGPALFRSEEVWCVV